MKNGETWEKRGEKCGKHGKNLGDLMIFLIFGVFLLEFSGENRGESLGRCDELLGKLDTGETPWIFLEILDEKN